MKTKQALPKTGKRTKRPQQRMVGQRNSAYLNLNTATYDIEDAKAAWRSGDDKECVRVIGDLMQQLESAKAKLKSKTTSNRPTALARCGC